jgi:Uma2 family endonuclease
MRKPLYMADLTRLVTAVDLARIAARDDYRYELVAGRVIRMSPVGWQHGVIVGRLLGMLVTGLRGRSVGEAVTEVGFTLRTNPDTVRAPDIAFVRQERLPRETLRTFWPGAPDVAMEVLSPDDNRKQMADKVADYASGGVSAVVVVDPDASIVTVHRPGKLRHISRRGDELELSDVIPGFRCAVDDIFD